MEKHVYSKFKNKNIPYAKVGLHVFRSLFAAETYCTQHGMDVNTAIEYGDDAELKQKVAEIAMIQKVVLRECAAKMYDKAEEFAAESRAKSEALQSCHPLDRGYLEDCRDAAFNKYMGAMEAREIVKAALEDLEWLTGWHG